MRKIICILLISFCLTSCQKCKRNPEPIDPGFNTSVNPDLHAYAYFKPGTYWIYQDSISGIIDSVYVTNANSGTYTNGDAEVAQGYYRGTFSWFKCDMISSYDHYKYENWMDQSYEVNGGLPRVFREKYIMPSSGSNYGKTIHMGIADIGKEFYIYPDKVIYENNYSNYLGLTQSYSSTQRWFNKQSIIDNEQDTYYYISKNIGVVRRVQIDSVRTWNLIRYQIIQ